MPKRGATSRRQLRCHGLFYTRDLASGERQRCRSKLVLEFCDTKPNDRTLLFGLMNPGASVPMDPDATTSIPVITHASQIPEMAVCLPTIPDATQAQTVLLMEAHNCGRAVVVNLTDVCEPNSSALGPCVTALANNTPRWDSLFHAPRQAELDNLLAAGPYVASAVGAPWGRSRRAYGAWPERPTLISLASSGHQLGRATGTWDSAIPDRPLPAGRSGDTTGTGEKTWHRY